MLKPGDRFERYTIEAPIGHGGMGAVYRAHDTRLGRRVALKVMSDAIAAPEASARLVREARAAAALDHPNAIAIFDAGECDGTPYVVMELVEGHTLRRVVGDRSVSLSARLGYLADVGRALASAHRRGLVHRDVKPENVMIRDDGMVKVLDFGIARRSGGALDPTGPTHTPALPTLTVEGMKLGTPVYMAPEQIRGDPLDGRADQFSWGVLAYEVLAGRLPWRGGDALAAMASVLTDPVDRGPLDEAGVPRAVQDVVLRALAKRREERFASMEDAVRALEQAAAGEELPAPDAAPREASSDPPRGATAAQRFSTAEVREVLGMAIDEQAAKQGTTKLDFEDLLAIARDVGVDPDSLAAASRALRARTQKAEVAPRGSTKPPAVADAAEGEAWVRRQKRNFLRHAGIFAIVNAALLVLGLVLLPFTPWWIWFLPLLGWGIGLAIHGLVAFTADEHDWRKQREELQWWREDRRRRHEERMSRGARRHTRPRVEVAEGGSKVRVAVDTGSVRAAEEQEAEAQAEELAALERPGSAQKRLKPRT